MGPGSCIDSEQGLIKHEQVIQFHILIPVFKQFLSSSPVSGSPLHAGMRARRGRHPLCPVLGDPASQGRAFGSLTSPGSVAWLSNPQEFIVLTEGSILHFKYYNTFY